MSNSIYNFFGNFNVVILALLAGLFTWSLTMLGATPVFFTKKFNQKILDGMLGFAAGVMLAASFWSLLAPALKITNNDPGPVAIGFLGGGLFVYLIDKVLPHLHLETPRFKAEGIKTTWHKSILLVLAVTLHNIPEGLAVGVAFGATTSALNAVEARHIFMAGLALTLGIGLQNLPEGLAVAMPLRREGMRRSKSFFYGQASGIVEPIAAVLGAACVSFTQALLPYGLSFAAGAMIFVCVEELIPESHRCDHSDIATICAILGFVVMMCLDVGLG